MPAGSRGELLCDTIQPAADSLLSGLGRWGSRVLGFVARAFQGCRLLFCGSELHEQYLPTTGNRCRSSECLKYCTSGPVMILSTTGECYRRILNSRILEATFQDSQPDICLTSSTPSQKAIAKLKNPNAVTLRTKSN